MVQIINTQGTIVTVDAKEVECPQIIGNLAETRAKTEYSCLTTDESVVSLGSITREPLVMKVLHNPASILGEQALDDSFANNTSVAVVVELSDTLGVNGTQYSFTGTVSKRTKEWVKDGAVEAEYTLEVSSAITETPAA